MKETTIKLSNSSDYWIDFEGDLSVYYHFKWNESSMSDFLDKEKVFVRKYIRLAKKFRIAIPFVDEGECDTTSNSFYCLYIYNNKLLYPTELFLHLNDKNPCPIISISPLLGMEDFERKVLHHGSIPLRIELIRKISEVEILCYIDNDAFNLTLRNKKCVGFEYPIDNSELAYLNTPRLNSFLRDLKKLCFEFGATNFEFENLGLANFSENGVLFNSEVVYYEDICDILSPSHRIVR